MRSRLALAVVLLAALAPALVGGAGASATGPPAVADRPAVAPPPAAAEPTTATTPNATDPPAIQAVYPDPVAAGDRGEFAVLALPADAETSTVTFSDGEVTVSLEDVPAGGRVAVANHPRAANLTDAPVVIAPDLALANAGERLVLHRGNRTVAERRYRDAEAGEVGRWREGRLHWRSLGATDRPVVTGGAGEVRAFVLPDAGGLPARELADADRRILLGGYTLTSKRVADRLANASERGVDVRVLLEGQPIGGRTRRGAETLDRLVAAGVEVRVLGGPHDRYAVHHAKYAVVDDRAVVLTENWKPSGTGGRSSRGWGVVTGQPRVVEGLAATFRADAGWRDARPWPTYRQGQTFERAGPPGDPYPMHVEPERVRVERTTLLVAPDNAQGELVATLDAAEERVDVVQLSLGDWDDPLVVALRRAADRGVRVRVLLSSAWYVREENRKMADRLNAWADRRDAPVTARLAEPNGRFGKVHAKGAVVDDERVVLGSLNWNEGAATANREVVLVLEGEAVADYFGDVYERDWQGGRERIPVGLVGAALGTVALVAVVGWRLRD